MEPTKITDIWADDCMYICTGLLTLSYCDSSSRAQGHSEQMPATSKKERAPLGGLTLIHKIDNAES